MTMEKIKVTQRIPTEAFAFIEFVGEYEDIETAFKEHRMMVRRAGEGLRASEWKVVRRKMYETGEFDVNIWNALNADQQYFINQQKLIHREMREEADPIIN